MSKKFFIIAAAVAFLAVLAYALISHEGLNPYKAHGTVDIKDSLLSFERSGKIIKLSADEGQQVQKGAILASLDAQDLDHRLRIQYANCQAEEALLTQYQNGYLSEELASAEASVQKSQAAVNLAAITYERNAANCQAEEALLTQYQNGYLSEELASAEASVQKSQAAVNLAAITYERNASLLKSKSISKQEFDSSKAAYDEAKATLKEAEAQLALYKRGYREEIISSQASKVTACKEQLSYLNYQINSQGNIVAPFSGTIRSRTHELSDFVGAGETIFSITDENVKKIRIYLSDAQLTLAKLGNTVSVERPYGPPMVGKISFISPTAMFTPKSVQTEDLRADLIYEISVEVEDPEHVLRFGQAITVYLKGEAPDNSHKALK